MMIATTGFCRDAVVVGVRFLQSGRWCLPPTPCLHHRSSSSLRSTTYMVLQPPDVGRLAETARITLSPGQVDAFAPKIKQVVEWFGQLQEVNLEKFEPAVRADAEINVQPREDLQETFKNREAILASVPSFEEPYIMVPKVLNAE